MAYFKVFEIDESKNLLEKALKIKPDFVQAHDLLLKIVASKNDKKMLIEQLKRAAEAEKDNMKKAKILAELAENQFFQKKYEDAAATATACLGIQNQNTAVAFIKAVALAKAEKAEEAATLIGNIVKSPTLDQETRAQLNFALGLIYSRSGKDVKVAEAAFKRADYAGFKYAAAIEINSLNGQTENEHLDTETTINTDLSEGN